MIDERAELARARRGRRRQASAGELKDLAVGQARRIVRERGTALLARVVDGAQDADLERRFGSAIAQRTMFAGMARAFEPEAAGGFQGRLVYELARPASGEEPTRWTIEVLDGHASARPGGSPEPALTVRFNLADFVRVAAGLLDPAAPLLAGRASFREISRWPRDYRRCSVRRLLTSVGVGARCSAACGSSTATGTRTQTSTSAPSTSRRSS